MSLDSSLSRLQTPKVLIALSSTEKGRLLLQAANHSASPCQAPAGYQAVPGFRMSEDLMDHLGSDVAGLGRWPDVRLSKRRRPKLGALT